MGLKKKKEKEHFLTLSLRFSLVFRCGSCKGGHACSTTDGACDGCQPGWNGTRCDRPCPSGYYGDGCQHKCPRCRSNEPCDPVSGECGRCEPGWSGPRCVSMFEAAIMGCFTATDGVVIEN